MIAFMINSALQRSHGMDFFQERIRTIGSKQGYTVVVHWFWLRTLQDDLVATFVGVVEVGVNFSELAVEIVRFEIHEFIFNVANGKERLYLVANFVE